MGSKSKGMPFLKFVKVATLLVAAVFQVIHAGKVELDTSKFEDYDYYDSQPYLKTSEHHRP